MTIKVVRKILDTASCQYSITVHCLLFDLILYIQVSNGAKIRNRYNQVPHLTQDTLNTLTVMSGRTFLGNTSTEQRQSVLLKDIM